MSLSENKASNGCHSVAESGKMMEIEPSEVTAGASFSDTSKNFDLMSYENNEYTVCAYDSSKCPDTRWTDKKISHWRGLETSVDWVNKRFLNNSDSGNAQQNIEMNIKDETSKNDGKRTTDKNLFDLSFDTQVDTLEESLEHFGLTSLLKELDESLDEVKRNKKSGEEHELFVKAIDKKMQKFSLTFHPDRVSNAGGSDLQLIAAQKLQSALNATRTVLKVLTEVFLENIDVDYRYEYFAKLEISSLVNENEIDHQISDVLYQISEFSEIKRVNIVGEIRKFLVESQRSLKSYLRNDEKDFHMYHDYALYHFKKCIDGYKKLVMECSILEKECKEESGENMKRIIHKISEQSSRELRILSKLENVVRDSLQGSFQIFPILEPMDEYFILPFVHYNNIMLMCNAMLQKKRKFFSFFQNLTERPNLENECFLFSKAYYLTSYFKGMKQYEKEVEKFTGKNAYAISKTDLRLKFEETLEEIVIVLENEFNLDAYKEGKSSREKISEKLLKLKREMADLQEIKRNLTESIRLCKKENQEIWKEYHQIMTKNDEEEKIRQNRKGNTKIMKEFSELLSNFKRDVTGNRGVIETGSGGSERKVIKDDEEILEKGKKNIETREGVRKEISELLSHYKQNVAVNRKVSEDKILENSRKNDNVGKVGDSNEMEEKIQKILEKNKIISEHFSEMLLQHRRNIAQTVGMSSNIQTEDSFNKNDQKKTAEGINC